MSGALPENEAAAPVTSDGQRKAGLRRAAIASVALLMLATAFWYVDAGDTAAHLPVAATNDAPAVKESAASVASAETLPPAPAPSATQSDATPPPSAVSSPDQPTPSATVAPGGDAAQPSPSAASASPGPIAAVTPPTAATAPTDLAAPAPEALPPPAAACPERPPAPAPVCPPAPDTPVGKLPSSPAPGPGYLIQLGVFVDTDNAESLRRELARKGYPAHLQSRVVLGPFPDRHAALAAQEKIRRERKLDGMILPPRKP